MALRRVATLVARGAPPEEVFAAVTAEVGRVLSADFTVLSRYDADGTYTAVGQWTSTDTPGPISVGDRISLGGHNTHTLVFQTGRPGAHIGHGSGLAGLQDRAEALGGRLSLQSLPGAGTILEIALPLDDPHP